MDFPAAEYQERVRRACALMKEQNLDALMVTGDYMASPNYWYFTGHLPRDFQANTARTCILLLTREGGAAISIYHVTQGGARQCWVQEKHLYTQPFRPTDALAIFEKLNLKSGRVGAELGMDQRLMMPVGDYEALKAALPGITWVDASPLLWKLRCVKSPAEVARIREADRINNVALQKTFATSRPGMTEREIYQKCVVELIQAGAIRPPHTQISISTTAREEGHIPFRGPSEAKLQAGDLVFIDSGAIFEGYWGEFNRMAVMGDPTPAQTRWHNIVRGIVMGFIEEILRPGITCEQAMKEAIHLYERAGVDPKQYERYVNWPYAHLCHGIGLSSSEPPLVRLTDDTVIEPGMTFSVEAYVNGDGMRYGSEEDVVITETGCEVLSGPIDAGLYIMR